MKQLLLLCALFVFTFTQAQVIENASFEDWESTTGPNDEPVDWSSIQTGTPDNLAGFASQVLFQSTDAHTGEYSLRLKNKFVAIANLVANGLATNGKCLLNLDPELANVHTDTSDADHHTTCVTRPDSLVGWYKYIPQGADVTEVQALLHTGYSSIPSGDSTEWVAMAVFTSENETVSEWTRFSAPFEYFSEDYPDYILINISSGDGFDAVADSEGWYDDLELVYNPVGLSEVQANHLLITYAREGQLFVDMRKFGAGSHYVVDVFDSQGRLVQSGNCTSGYSTSFFMEESGIYIVKLEGPEGSRMTKKVFVD